jgi:hypothetical protein
MGNIQINDRVQVSNSSEVHKDYRGCEAVVINILGNSCFIEFSTGGCITIPVCLLRKLS